jgi:hypothetical protein
MQRNGDRRVQPQPPISIGPCAGLIVNRRRIPNRRAKVIPAQVVPVVHRRGALAPGAGPRLCTTGTTSLGGVKIGRRSGVMCGRSRGCKVFLRVQARGRVRSCVRPVCAVLVTAGPDEVRGPGPNQFSALEARPDPHGVARSRRSTVVPSSPKSPCLVAHHMTDGLMRRAGTLRPAPGAPRRCAPSCWPARRPRPCVASCAAVVRATGL